MELRSDFYERDKIINATDKTHGNTTDNTRRSV